MILSILIPVYNYKCIDLVKDLQTQAESCAIAYEILVADDGSVDEDSVRANREVNALPHSAFHELKVNRGRAFMRNWLTARSRGTHLLFVDSDAGVADSRFVQRYVEAAAVQADAVICGGILHPDELPSAAVSLRYRYEKAMEPRFVASERNQRPYANLRTFNFMMPRHIAVSHPFDESITLYGYEDTLLGSQLEADGARVVHIDNPLLNTDIEENAVFLAKTEESMRCLCAIRDKMKGHSRLLEHYNSLQRCGLRRLLRTLFPILRPLMVRQLCSSRPCVGLFQLYKLCYYCTLT